MQLAFIDFPVTEAEKIDIFTDRLGGHPIFPSRKELPICTFCGSNLFLLTQIFAQKTPLIFRILYVFLCNNENCSEFNKR
jgi:hypothetical protein